MKCSQCREHDAELLTRWERVRDWMFRWFQTDIADLSQAKYTQGFSDGWTRGYDSGRQDRTLDKIEEGVKENLAKVRELLDA